MTKTAQTEEVKIYDADAEQRYTLTVEDDDAKYETTQVYGALTDEALTEYDRLREVLLESDGNKNDLNTDSTEADEYLFDELCTDVEGFDGEKPADWKAQIDYDEKKFGINKLLGVKIISSNKEKQVKKREWGKKISQNAVTLKSRFNGDIVTTKAFFPDKTPADIAAYSLIKNRVSLVDRDLEDSAIKIPASMKRKAAIFDRINPKVEGYAGRVPLHHRAAFVTGFFEPRISDAEKK